MSGSLKIKVCGMRDPENIAAIAALDPDMMGFIFYEKSRRYAGALPPEALAGIDIPKIGVFVDSPREAIHEAIESYGLQGVQLHGHEDPGLCEALRRSHPELLLSKAFGVAEGFDFAALDAYAPWCSYFLFDTRDPGYGGTGRSFDWSLLASYSQALPFILAGGVGLDAVEAIRRLQAQERRLWGIDINSRVEEAPGLKSVEAVAQLLKELRN